MGNQIQTSVTIINSLLGFQALSYTAHNTSAACAIAAGSKVEIDGAFFNFPSNETVNSTSWNSITTATTAFIALTPSGTAGSQTVSASYISTTPVWSTSKQGWYLSAGSNVRVIGSCYKTSSTQFDRKMFLGNAENELYNYRMRGETDFITTAGSSTYTVKDGVYRLGVIVVGGGGGGAGSFYDNSSTISQMGGGGGGTIISNALIQYIDVVPGQSISYTVGAGGAGGNRGSFLGTSGTVTGGSDGASSLFGALIGYQGKGAKLVSSTINIWGGSGSNTIGGCPGESGGYNTTPGNGGGAGGFIIPSTFSCLGTAGPGGGGGGGYFSPTFDGKGGTGGTGIIIIQY